MSELNLPLVGLKPGDLSGSTLADAARRAAARGGPGGPVRDDLKLAQAAKDFESVLLAKMMEEMHNTVEDSGLLEDSGSSQMQGMFWNMMAQDVANKGGLGLWKDLYDQWSRVPGSDQGASAAAKGAAGPASEVHP